MKRRILLLAVLTMLGALSYCQVVLLQSRDLDGRGSDSNAVRNVQTKPTMENDAEIVVRGELLKAFQAAHTAFLQSSVIPSDKKRIENYDVRFSKAADGLVVLFVPRLKPGERLRLGGATELGMAVRFVVSTDNYRVIDMKFYR